MKKAGIIGGTSWYSTLDLYRYINTYVGKTLGKNNCAKMALININMQEIIDAPDKDRKGAIMAEAAKAAEAAGSDFVVICSNGLHEYAPYVTKAVSIPLIHIADSTADAIIKEGVKTVGLLGAKATMERDFYVGHLKERGLKVLIPELEDRIFIDDVVFKEVSCGIIKEESCAKFYEIAEKLVQNGAEAVILGCTEIGELMQQEHTPIPLFDTTQIHANVIANLCLDE